MWSWCIYSMDLILRNTFHPKKCTSGKVRNPDTGRCIKSLKKLTSMVKKANTLLANRNNSLATRNNVPANRNNLSIHNSG